METKIGKIQQIHVGYGSYQDAQLGVSVTLGSDKDAWGVVDFKGFWGMKPSPNAKWSAEDQRGHLGDTFLWLGQLLNDAKKTKVEALTGVPVECTFENMTLKSWRVLTEVI